MHGQGAVARKSAVDRDSKMIGMVYRSKIRRSRTAQHHPGPTAKSVSVSG
jgi:hypothetical protein